MTWLTLALALIRLASAFLDRAAHKRAVSEGEARAIKEMLEATNERIEIARRARDGVDHGKLPDDDPYRRD